MKRVPIALVLVLTTLFLNMGLYSHVSAQQLTSWNSHVSCNPVFTTIQELIGPTFNQTTGGALENGPFGIVVESSLHPPCIAPNVNGTIAPTFVEVHGISLTGLTHVSYGSGGGKCGTKYSFSNGGGPYPGNNTYCGSYGVFQDRSVYTRNCEVLEPTPKICVRLEIDRDWLAAGYCGSGTPCNDSAFDILDGSQKIDVQGFVTWHLPSSPGHGYSSWEIHPLTGWKFSQVDPPVVPPSRPPPSPVIHSSQPQMSPFAAVIFVLAVLAVVTVVLTRKNHKDLNKSSPIAHPVLKF